MPQRRKVSIQSMVPQLRHTQTPCPTCLCPPTCQRPLPAPLTGSGPSPGPARLIQATSVVRQRPVRAPLLWKAFHDPLLPAVGHVPQSSGPPLGLPTLDVLRKWNPTTCGLLCLAFFLLSIMFSSKCWRLHVRTRQCFLGRQEW